jgi:hypothetical protein
MAAMPHESVGAEQQDEAQRDHAGTRESGEPETGFDEHAAQHHQPQRDASPNVPSDEIMIQPPVPGE